MGKIRSVILKIQDTLLCFTRKWWRPYSYLTIVTSVVVNAIYLPIKKGEPVDISHLALLVTAFAPIIAIRAWEKVRGPPEPST